MSTFVFKSATISGRQQRLLGIQCDFCKTKYMTRRTEDERGMHLRDARDAGWHRMNNAARKKTGISIVGTTTPQYVDLCPSCYAYYQERRPSVT